MSTRDRMISASISRRDLIRMSAAAGGGFALSGAGIAGAQEASPSVPTSFHEAPEFAEQVGAGSLLPVAERLPKVPMVLETEQIGTYGGDYRLEMYPFGRINQVHSSMAYEYLLRWRPNADALTVENVIPNVLENFEVRDDGARYVFYLREGLKWSDGEPYTVDDILFWFNDIIMDKELTPGTPTFLPGPDNPTTVEKIDDYTVEFRFERPFSLFLVNMASQRGGGPTNHPQHYLSQYLKKNNPEVVELAKEANLEDWTAYFQNFQNAYENPQRPHLNAWNLTEPLGDTLQQLVCERNPYYFKVDTEGNQLPYIDRVVYTTVENTEVGLLRALNGETNIVYRRTNEVRNKPVFFDNQEEGDYRFFDIIDQDANQMGLFFNMTHRDPGKREIFANTNFRIAMSHAINRQEIIDAVYQSQGEPFQLAPREESPFYHERLATQYTEFDPETSTQMLDEILPDKDDSGYRLGPDGERLSILFEVLQSRSAIFAPALELVKQRWTEVGVEIAIKVEDDELYNTRMLGNQHDACAFHIGGGLGVLMDPMFYFPYNANAKYAMPWQFWFRNPDDEKAIEPPDVVKQQFDLYRQIEETIDPEQTRTLVADLLDIAADQFYGIGIASLGIGYGTVANGLKNTPTSTIGGWLHCEIMPTNPQQYFWQE